MMNGIIFRLADEVVDELMLKDVPDLFIHAFAEKVLNNCMIAIEERYSQGDLSERAQGMRNAKAAIRRYFEAEV